MATAAEIKALALTRLAETLANPKPSYSIDGQSVSWTEYQKMLQETIRWADEQAATDAGPYESIVQITGG